MVELENKYLVTRNARDKIQQVNTILIQDGNVFTIKRITGQYQGKLTNQPELTIGKGKAKRTPREQAELEYNSIIKKYLDKGYKDLKDLTNSEFKNITPEELEKLVPSSKSDQSGFYKPMLAKEAHKVPSSTLNKPMWCSKKLDGVRNMMQLDQDNNIVAISRGGGDYNVPSTHIREKLVDFFNNHPEIILDGELYHHGHYLQELSGVARLKEWSDRCKILQYHVYDIVDPEKTFNERLEIIEELKPELESAGVFVLEHIKTNSYLEMKKLHDKWVEEGYEGLVARKPDDKYMVGKRGSSMLKLKSYLEESFEIIDYQDGLRDEDFCFILQTKEGKQFAAKPVGSRELKEYYIQNIDDIIGKLGDVKFFDFSKDNIPMQPVFKSVRWDIS